MTKVRDICSRVKEELKHLIVFIFIDKYEN